MNLPEPPRPDLTGPPPPPPSRLRKDHSARNWTIAIVVIVGLIIVGAMNKNASDSTGDTGNESSVEDSGIDPGLGTQDASGDVTLESCREGRVL